MTSSLLSSPTTCDEPLDQILRLCRVTYHKNVAPDPGQRLHPARGRVDLADEVEPARQRRHQLHRLARVAQAEERQPPERGHRPGAQRLVALGADVVEQEREARQERREERQGVRVQIEDAVEGGRRRALRQGGAPCSPCPWGCLQTSPETDGSALTQRDRLRSHRSMVQPGSGRYSLTRPSVVVGNGRGRPHEHPPVRRHPDALAPLVSHLASAVLLAPEPRVCTRPFGARPPRRP